MCSIEQPSQFGCTIVPRLSSVEPAFVYKIFGDRKVSKEDVNDSPDFNAHRRADLHRLRGWVFFTFTDSSLINHTTSFFCRR